VSLVKTMAFTAGLNRVLILRDIGSELIEQTVARQ